MLGPGRKRISKLLLLSLNLEALCYASSATSQSSCIYVSSAYQECRKGENRSFPSLKVDKESDVFFMWT